MDAAAKITISIIVMTLLMFGASLGVNVVRAQWTPAIIAAGAIVLLGTLYYALNHWPWAVRPAQVLVAMAMMGTPPAMLAVQPAAASAVMPMAAVGGVLIVSLLWPRVALVLIGVETVTLAVLSLGSEHVTIHAAASFPVVAIAVNMAARWLLETQARAQSVQASADEGKLRLERTVRSLEETVADQSRQMATIRELQAPLIESEQDVGLLVVVGHCDADRIQTIQADLFERLGQRTLKRLVVDISGADFGKAGLEAFVKILQAMQLMISDIVVSGMSTQLAETLTEDRGQVRSLRRTVSFVHSLQEAFTRS